MFISSLRAEQGCLPGVCGWLICDTESAGTGVSRSNRYGMAVSELDFAGLGACYWGRRCGDVAGPFVGLVEV